MLVLWAYKLTFISLMANSIILFPYTVSPDERLYTETL